MRKDNDKYLSSDDEDLLNMIREYEEEEKEVKVAPKKVFEEDMKTYAPSTNQSSFYNEKTTFEDESALKPHSNPSDYDKTLTILRSTDKSSENIDTEESFKVEEDEFVHDFVEEEVRESKRRKEKKPKKKMSDDKVNKVITRVIIGLVVVFLIGGGVFAWDVFFNKDDDKKSEEVTKDKDKDKKPAKKPTKKPAKDPVEVKPEDHSAEIAKLQGLINTENNNIIAKQKELINLNETLTEKTNLVNTLAGQQGQLERDIETEKNKTEDKDVEQIAKWESELKEVINKLNTANGEMSSAQTAVNNANQYITDAGNRKDNYQNQINNFKN